MLQWFQHSGRRCEESTSLSEAGVRHGSTVQMHLRLRGGGGDGGATGAESRSSYLEMYMEKKPDKVRIEIKGFTSPQQAIALCITRLTSL